MSCRKAWPPRRSGSRPKRQSERRLSGGMTRRAPCRWRRRAGRGGGVAGFFFSEWRGVGVAWRQGAEACAFFFAELERGERELPPALAGLPAVEIFKRLHNFTETLRKAGKGKFEVRP